MQINPKAILFTSLNSDTNFMIKAINLNEKVLEWVSDEMKKNTIIENKLKV